MTDEQKAKAAELRAKLRERLDHLGMLRGMTPGSPEGERNMARAIERVEAQIAELRASLAELQDSADG